MASLLCDSIEVHFGILVPEAPLPGGFLDMFAQELACDF